jgi:uncharacterized RDD family membrane protein YckC
MSADHYGPRVILPRRIKADLLDGLIAAAIFLGPLLLGQALTGTVPGAYLRPLALSIPIAIGYSLLRDAVGGGTSLGKRLLGLRVIRAEDGRACTAGRVWTRNLLDVIPILDVVDFVAMCLDARGQKLMDRRLRTQVVEVSDPNRRIASLRPSGPVALAPQRPLASLGRRLLIVLAYGAGSLVLFVVAVSTVVPQACQESARRCSVDDRLLLHGLFFGWVGLVAVIVGLGASGRLWGARRR